MKRPEIRFLSDMRKVLYDQKWAKNAPNFPVYYMYRGVKPQKKALAFLRGKKKNELRYDITVIPPRMLGKEFPKTKGHTHSQNFQELYKVLKGKAFFLLQKYKNKKIEDVFVIKAKMGDVIIVPPEYGHITINPTKTELKIGNFISEKCQNIYNLFEKRRGGCYYFTKRGWIKNKNYIKIPKIRFEKPLKSMPKNLDFLAPH